MILMQSRMIRLMEKSARDFSSCLIRCSNQAVNKKNSAALIQMYISLGNARIYHKVIAAPTPQNKNLFRFTTERKARNTVPKPAAKAGKIQNAKPWPCENPIAKSCQAKPKNKTEAHAKLMIFSHLNWSFRSGIFSPIGKILFSFIAALLFTESKRPIGGRRGLRGLSWVLILNCPELSFVFLQIVCQGRDHTLEMAGTGDNFSSRHALPWRRKERDVDEVQNKLFF